MMKTRFIQSGFPRSASTLLVNALMGLIVGMEEMPVYFTDFVHQPFLNDAPLDVFKTHNTNLAQVADFFPSDYRLFFIGSERTPISGKTDKVHFSTGHFDEKSRAYDNVVIFDFKDISDATVCRDLYDIVGFMAPDVAISRPGCEARVAAMNRRYAEIAHLPFTYTDPFYQLHGSHRSRIPPMPRKRLRGAGSRSKG